MTNSHSNIQSAHALSHLQGLYHSDFEKDNCGLGLVACLKNKPSKKIVTLAIQSLCKLSHRGGMSADGVTGDGCGLLLQKPDCFFRRVASELFTVTLEPVYAVGMVFLSQDDERRKVAQKILQQELEKQQLTLIGWRQVPVNRQVLGDAAQVSEPQIYQIFVQSDTVIDEAVFNRQLYKARRFAEMQMRQQCPDDSDFYVASLHSQTIIFKGLMMPATLSEYYLDLLQEDFKTAVCSYHQRFSTNTLPQWRLAQPFRYLAHNGELNTIRGNRNWAVARAKQFHSAELPELNQFEPIVSQSGSDSSSLDNMLEALTMGGIDMVKALRILIPPAWQNNPKLSSEIKDFFNYYSHQVEPWDGPAGIMLHDGKRAICALDRNGLRPSRYVITRDDIISFSSEVGVLDEQPENIKTKGRLAPGQLIYLDIEKGELTQSGDLLKRFAATADYTKAIEARLSLPPNTDDWSYLLPVDKNIRTWQKFFNLSFEERDQVIRVLAEDSQEATGSMGDDAPLAAFSNHVRSLYDFFRQVFAQVTNPPIDSLRENIVMALDTLFGSEPDIFTPTVNDSRAVHVSSPILTASQMQQLRQQQYLKQQTFSLHFPADLSLADALTDLCHQVERAIQSKVEVIILSDTDIQPKQTSIHCLMAVGAVHHHLVKCGLRTQVNLVAETATARDPHHFAVLFGYGATAVYPYLAYMSIYELCQTQELVATKSPAEYCANYIKGINKGLLKIFSKMGISTVNSYRGAQLFEIVGLDGEVIEVCFRGSTNRIGGFSFAQLEADQQRLSAIAFNPRTTIAQGGLLKYVHGGEQHAYDPGIVDLLRTALQQGNQKAYDQFAQAVNNRRPIVIRDFLKLNSKYQPIDISEVEPAEKLYPRFDGAGISMGALSTEAHESIAIALNTLGGRSNSGEGGEDPRRFGTNKNSKIKQIASGRFGATTAYLMSAEVIQIKIAQGAKPGEGGQLPGAKVDQYIAELRYSTPGVTLISPPPHHDIYSIEDLAQLIYDLKQVNPQALVSVKLVSAPGVGTVAAGVVKTYADLITISGYDGGTGASPLTSVKYAGSPFELGLSEARQVLRANNLRGQIRLQADGGLKTGLDVVKAAILGAESFGFGTAPMIALGCKYLRICHLNICPVGIATQKEQLRKEHFHGMPEMVINYFRFVAEEVRQILADLGVRSLSEIIGRTEFLKVLDASDKRLDQRFSGLKFADLLSNEGIDENQPHYCQVEKNEPWDKGEVAESVLAALLPAIENKTGGEFQFTINNLQRSMGARVSGEIAKRYGNLGMQDNPIQVKFTGIAGQSFGAWNVGGLELYLEGDANDYVGKGMSGGKIVITHPPEISALPDYQRMPIMGNTCLYGATQGKLYADGSVGERFAVRNSGVNAVVLGVGDHGCEYMTGGVVIILGKVGINFGAGMSGGCAFVYDPKNQLARVINPEMIEVAPLSSQDDRIQQLFEQQLIDFVEHTHSKQGTHLFTNLATEKVHFKFVKAKAMELETLLTAVTIT